MELAVISEEASREYRSDSLLAPEHYQLPSVTRVVLPTQQKTLKIPTVVLRYDASPEIGAGHAARAQILAAAFELRGMLVLHAVSESSIPWLETWRINPGSLINIKNLEQWRQVTRDVSHIVIDTLWTHNACKTSEEIRWLRASSTAHITVIDSMPPDHFQSDNDDAQPHLLLTPYLGAEKFSPPASSKTRWVTGPAYCLLHAEYKRLQKVTKRADKPTILISCGGSDTDGLTLRIASVLAAFSVKVEIVVGPLFDKSLCEQIQQLCILNSQLRTHWQPATLAPIIANCDLVVGRPGLLRYEAAALGKRALYLARGNAYREYFEGFQSAGVAEIHFETDTQGISGFIDRLLTLKTEMESGTFSSHNSIASALVQANGADTFIDMLVNQQPAELSHP